MKHLKVFTLICFSLNIFAFILSIKYSYHATAIINFISIIFLFMFSRKNNYFGAIK